MYMRISFAQHIKMEPSSLQKRTLSVSLIDHQISFKTDETEKKEQKEYQRKKEARAMCLVYVRRSNLV